MAAVDTYRDVQADVEGQPAALVSRDLRLHAERGRYLMVQEDWNSVLRRAAESGGVVVSEVLANRLTLKRGNRISVPSKASSTTMRPTAGRL